MATNFEDYKIHLHYLLSKVGCTRHGCKSSQ